jgi:hypothetical protein
VEVGLVCWKTLVPNVKQHVGMSFVTPSLASASFLRSHRRLILFHQTRVSRTLVPSSAFGLGPSNCDLHCRLSMSVLLGSRIPRNLDSRGARCITWLHAAVIQSLPPACLRGGDVSGFPPPDGEDPPNGGYHEQCQTQHGFPSVAGGVSPHPMFGTWKSKHSWVNICCFQFRLSWEDGGGQAFK